VHHHGRIHYECHHRAHFAPGSQLRFEEDDWRFVCAKHRVQIQAELGGKSAQKDPT
jgi:hypothetical protein